MCAAFARQNLKVQMGMHSIAINEEAGGQNIMNYQLAV